MQTVKKTVLCISAMCFIILSCKTSQYSSSKNNDEETTMKIDERPDVIDYAKLKEQKIPQLGDRGNSRGLVLGPILGSAISLATDAVKKMIAKDREKYTADYSFAMTDLYFYDQLSTESAFDPIGMQFNGFRVIRLVERDGKTDTAMIADFALDTLRPYEIINNSIFRLRLKNLKLNYAKAKITSGQKNKINMDFEINFKTSYVNDMGQLFNDVELGKFYFLVRNAPVDKNEAGYQDYYNNQKGKMLDGKSFIVPRSFGYHVVGPNQTKQSFSQGAYSIQVNVRESSKDKFVTKVLVDNSGKLIDMLSDKARGALNQ